MFLNRLNHQEFSQAMVPKKQKYRNTKGGKEKESLQKGFLKINETGKKEAGNQKLLPYKMIPKKRYLKSQLSQLVIKRSSSGIQHEKSCHLTKWWRILESNVGAKNLCFL